VNTIATQRESTQLWFPIADLLPLVEHVITTGSVRPDPQWGTQPVLTLTAQGRLRYLSTNAWPPLLVDAFDPASVQRVYAVGYGYRSGGMTYPADEDRYGAPTRIGSIPLTGGGRRGLFGQPLDRLRGASRVGCDWLVLTTGTETTGTQNPDVQLQWEVCPLPHPAPAAQWRDVRLEIFGLPGSWPGQVVTNATYQGWLLPRFTPPVAAQIAAVLAEATDLPRLVTRVRLTETAVHGDAVHGDAVHGRDGELVALDPDGFYRIGEGWPWVSPDLLPDGRLLPYRGPHQPGIDPVELPAVGQDAFTGMGCLMWLDESGDLVLRSIYDEGFDPTDPPGSPEYGNVDPDAEWQFRAVEHELRKAAALRAVGGGLAAAVTPPDVHDGGSPADRPDGPHHQLGRDGVGG
jgi:hypothetical protein